MGFLIQHFEADFLWKVSLKILNSGLILKTFTHVFLFSYKVFVIRAWIHKILDRIRKREDPDQIASSEAV